MQTKLTEKKNYWKRWSCLFCRWPHTVEFGFPRTPSEITIMQVLFSLTKASIISFEAVSPTNRHLLLHGGNHIILQGHNLHSSFIGKNTASKRFGLNDRRIFSIPSKLGGQGNIFDIISKIADLRQACSIGSTILLFAAQPAEMRSSATPRKTNHFVPLLFFISTHPPVLVINIHFSCNSMTSESKKPAKKSDDKRRIVKVMVGMPLGGSAIDASRSMTVRRLR